MDERNFKEIIKQAQQVLYCPTCGRKYQLDEIRLKGFIEEALILQTICSNNHAPVLTLYMTNSVDGIKAQKAVAKEPVKARVQKVTKDDVLDLHQSLKEFDGNFRNLWNIS